NGLGLLNMGVSPNLFPGQKWINDIEERKKFETAWKTNLPEQPGLSIDKILEKTFTEDIRVIYLMGDIPESIEHDDIVKRSLSKAELLVIQSPYHSRLFSDAEVILPPLTLEESDGTITNIEGRISPLSVPVSMRGQNKQGREIIAQISTLMGYPMQPNSIDEINSDRITG
ncbi:MAG: molybdopterin-dependent oxidoreductase, partial [Desulfobacterales bacterium]|nr:molybdopterin-dependent oxidoreductase [Desulfobacterales bacterium]